MYRVLNVQLSRIKEYKMPLSTTKSYNEMEDDNIRVVGLLSFDSIRKRW